MVTLYDEPEAEFVINSLSSCTFKNKILQSKVSVRAVKLHL